ncbi:MAG: hypothetical protein KBD23_05540 [Gammaproteobacteria bacterium]|nr:hypothetical protein [Gammaproteobacteria bacterium]
MSIYNKDYHFKLRLQHDFLAKAVQQFGKAQALCDAHNKMLQASEPHLTRECLNHYKNGTQKISYIFAILISYITRIPIQFLAPFHPTLNKILNAHIIQWSINRVIVSDAFCDPMQTMGSVILIDSEGVLISGLSTLKFYQSKGAKDIPAIVIDFEELISALENQDPSKRLRSYSLIDFEYHFLFSQQAAISLAFQCFLQTKHPSKLHWGVSECIAKFFGFDSKESMQSAQKIYLNAPEYWIAKIDCGLASIPIVVEMLDIDEIMLDFKRAEIVFSKKFKTFYQSITQRRSE